MLKKIKIIEIEDSGNNGIVYKALDKDEVIALKVMYGFSQDIGQLQQKAKREYEIGLKLNNIENIPKTLKLYNQKKRFIKKPLSFSCVGFNEEEAKKQIMKNRIHYQSDSYNDIVFAGAFTMDYMENLTKLPKDPQPLNFTLPNSFFEKLEDIAEKMLERGYSLPPERDYLIKSTKILDEFEPIVLDFGNCESLDILLKSGHHENSAKNYIRIINKKVIDHLREVYAK